MKNFLTIVPRKKYMGKNELQQKIEAGLISVVFHGENIEPFYGFLLSREMDISKARVGDIYDLDYAGEIIHAQFKAKQTFASDLGEYCFEILNESEFVEQRVPLVTAGTAVGEKKGATIFVAKESIVLRGRKNTLPSALFLDVSGVDVNQKVFVRDLNFPKGVTPKQGSEKQLVLECKYKFRDSTVLDALREGWLQEAV